MKINHISYEEPVDIFYDPEEPGDDQYHSYYDHDTKQVEFLKYYDPSDKIPDKVMYGKAIHLKIDCSMFIRTNEMDNFLDNLNDHDLFGRQPPLDFIP